MATLTNKKIKDTYKSLLKVSDNGNLEADLQEITDGEGNASGVQLNTAGDLTASGTVAFGSLKDSGENITISKFVDEADGIPSNDNDTTIPTSAAVKNYVDTKVTAEDLDFGGDSGTGSVDLDSQTFTIAGTANEVVTSASGQTLTVGLPSTINVDVQGDLTGNVTGNVSGNVTGNVTGNVSGDLTGNVTATSVLANGVTATTQASSDNSTKVATTAFVKSVVTAEDLDFAGDSGTGAVDLDSQTLSVVGTANEIVTSASGQTLTVGLPSSITVDVTGNLTGNVSGNVTGDVTGNADTATALETSRTIALSGDVVGSGSFDGSANLTLSTAIQPNSVALGTDTTGDYVSNLGAGTGVTIANNTGEGSNPTIAVNYGSTANTSVEGDTLVTVQGTANEIEVSGGAVTLGAGGTVTVGLPDNVIIAGDLTVNGTTTTINTQTLSVEDPLIELANQNASNSVDTGFFANYSLDAGVTTKYAGLFKDSSDSDKFKLFKGLEVEPATTVDVAGTGYTKGDLVVNDLDAVTISGDLTGDVTGDLTGTVLTAAQPNITSVGTLDGLSLSDDIVLNKATGAVDITVRSQDGSNTSILFGDSADNNTGRVTYDHSLDALELWTNDTQQVTVDSSGNVGIGVDSPLAKTHIKSGVSGFTGSLNANYDDLAIEGSGNTGITFLTQNANNAGIAFSDEDAELQGSITYRHSIDAMTFDTNGSEAIRIDSSGNVGIGTSSPTAELDVNGDINIATGNSLTFGSSSVGILGNASGADYITFNTNSGERLRIDSSGNVGIGTSSPDVELEIASGAPQVRLTDTDGGYCDIANVSGNLFLQADKGGTQSGSSIRFDVDASEAMRIDSSGNVLIGQTAASDTTAGVYLAQDGRSTITRDDSFVLQLNRLTSDGAILRFRQDGSTVGTITSSGTSIGIGFEGGAAANTLDDYEEGTFTPVVSDAATGGNTASGTFVGTYTKIGRIVNITVTLDNIDTTGMTSGNTFLITGLPFTVVGNSYGSLVAHGVSFYLADYSYFSAQATGGTDYALIRQTGGSIADRALTVAEIDSSNSDIYFTITYRA